MRISALGLVVCVVGCSGSKSEPPAPKERPATSGPIESIVHRTELVMRLDAVRHRVELPETALGAWIGLPVRGTAEIDADLTMPVVDGKPVYDRANGTLAVRCVKDCRIGDDVAKFVPKVSARAQAFVGDGIPFGHVDIDELEVRLEVVNGLARLTRWVFRSPDVTLDVAMTSTLAADLDLSAVDACVRFKATEALEKRDPQLAGLLTLAGGWRGPDGTSHIAVTGTVGNTRVTPKECK